MTHPALAIEVHGVSYAYGSERAVSNATFAIEKGDFLGIIGPNGGGKTTLLRLILGVIKPESGTIRLLGEEPVRARSRTGYVPQETSSNKFFPIRVKDVVLMGLTARRGLGRRFSIDNRKQADAVLDELGLLELRNRSIGSLSGGQRQKVLLARALVAAPEILFLDEPTSSIDTSGTDEIYSHLSRLNDRGTTIALVTHNVGVVSKYIKSVACINKELFFHPDGHLTEATVTKTFGCPVDLIAHGLPHRVYHDHREPHTHA